uniref:Uncharacterized protein n=1 Tax=Globodera rostochiensis TaxID=31243 RepID=A0A914GQC1_GLORO
MIPPTSTSLLEKCNAIAEKRARRKLKTKTTEIIDIDATILLSPPTEIAEKFGSFLDRVVGSKSSRECYQIVLNSLSAVHAKEYPCHSQSDQQVSVNIFLKKLLKCFNEIDAHGSQGLSLYELFVLLEVHLLRSFPVHLSQTQIVARLRAIYVASEPVAFRHFLDDVLCDEFLDDLPFYLAGIYEQLLLEMPLDLQRFQSQEYRQDISGGQVEFKNKLAERLGHFVKELEVLDKVTEEEMETIEEGAKKTENDEEMMTRAPKKSTKAIHPSSKEHHSLARRRIQVIPETPEKTNPQNEMSSSHQNGENDVIEQTPIGKICGSGSNKASKFARLLQSEEERFSRMRLVQSNPSTKRIVKAKRALNVLQHKAENGSLEKDQSLVKSSDEPTNLMLKRGKRPPTPSNSSSSIAPINKRPKRPMHNSSIKSTTSSTRAWRWKLYTKKMSKN